MVPKPMVQKKKIIKQTIKNGTLVRHLSCRENHCKKQFFDVLGVFAPHQAEVLFRKKQRTRFFAESTPLNI